MENNSLLNSTSLIEKTISECFAIRVKTSPDKVALEFEGESYTWAELDRLSDWLVWRFDSFGIKRGTRAAIWCGNNAQWVVVYLGLMKIGAVAVLINPGYLADELHRIVSYSKVEFLFYGEEFKGASLPDILGELDLTTTPLLRQTIPIELKDAIRVLREGADSLDDSQRERIEYLKTLPEVYDTACMLFTSGTTSTPKGVLLSHYNLVNDSIISANAMHWNENDKTCVMVPLFHCFGMTSCLLGCIMSGGALYLMKYYKTIDALVAIQDYGCTVLNGVPSMFLAIVNNSRFDEFDLSSLKSGIIAGSPLSEDEYKFICKRLQIDKLQMSYGQTETSPGVTFSEYDECIEEKCDNAGYLIPYIETCIWEASGQKNVYYCDVVKPDGRTLTGFEKLETDKAKEFYVSTMGDRRIAYCRQGDFFRTGEIGVKGFNVMQGYFEKPEATAEALEPDGWLHTGDLGYVDDSGRLHIVGRIKEMIIRGGENISPLEIEECIRSLPQVKEVKVVGVPQAVLQEEIAACVALVKDTTLTSEEIVEHCKKNLAGYKVPRYIKFFDELPVNSSNKIKLGELKDIMKVFAQENPIGR